MYGYTMSITIHNHFCCTICFEEKRMKNPKDRIREIEKRLEQLPKGTLTYKTINGRKQPYVQRSLDGRSVSFYVKMSECEQVYKEAVKRKDQYGAFLVAITLFMVYNTRYDKKRREHCNE